MYKIYINETPLFLVNTDVLADNFESGEDILIAPYRGKGKNLLNYIDLLEKSQRFRRVVLHHNDEQELIEEFEAKYKIIEAAGGLVFNDRAEILAIFRRDFWDLPKGKIDKGEGVTAAALREVEEETGLKNLRLGEKLTLTYHTYRSRKNKRILKRTYWYTMHSSQEALIPQAEEDIEQAIWIAPDEFLLKNKPVYGNILEVVEKGLEMEQIKNEKK